MTIERYTDDDGGRFNITPVIDVVFLLIIFFMIVCQFIAAENFTVEVPDDISQAQSADDPDSKTTTVTVISQGGDDAVKYAVGATVVAYAGDPDISSSIATQIDTQLANLPNDKRTVALRIDKVVTYKHSKHAISAISQSTATDIKLAVIRQQK